MDSLKDFIKKNHSEPAQMNPFLQAKTWAKIEHSEKPSRFYISLSLAVASLAMVIGVNVNLRSPEQQVTRTTLPAYDEEVFVVENYSDFEENLQESQDSMDEYAFGF